MQNIYVIGGGLVGLIGVVILGFWLAFHHGKRKSLATNSRLAVSLQDAQARSQIILQSIEDGVVFLDEQGTIQLFNPGAAAITGWSQEDAQGLEWNSVFVFLNKQGEPVDSTDTPFGKALKSGVTIRDNEANLKSKSGNTIAANFSVTPLVADAHVTGLVGIFRDGKIPGKQFQFFRNARKKTSGPSLSAPPATRCVPLSLP